MEEEEAKQAKSESKPRPSISNLVCSGHPSESDTALVALKQVRDPRDPLVGLERRTPQSVDLRHGDGVVAADQPVRLGPPRSKVRQSPKHSVSLKHIDV